MMPSRGPLNEKLFRYARHKAELTVDGLGALGFSDIEPESVQKLDSVAAIPALEVGKAVADRTGRARALQFRLFKP
jgi:uncharacterized protein